MQQCAFNALKSSYIHHTILNSILCARHHSRSVNDIMYSSESWSNGGMTMWRWEIFWHGNKCVYISVLVGLVRITTTKTPSYFMVACALLTSGARIVHSQIPCGSHCEKQTIPFFFLFREMMMIVATCE